MLHSCHNHSKAVICKYVNLMARFNTKKELNCDLWFRIGSFNLTSHLRRPHMISTLLKFPTYLETSHMNTSKSLRLQPINTTTKYVVTCNMKNTHLKKERCPVSPVVLHFLVLLRRAQHFQTGSHFPREKAISNQSWNFTQRRPSDTSYSQILPSQR